MEKKKINGEGISQLLESVKQYVADEISGMETEACEALSPEEINEILREAGFPEIELE